MSSAQRIGRFVAVVAAIGIVLASCSSVHDTHDMPAFYRTPWTIPTDPAGTIVRIQSMTPPSAASVAWRIMYTSRDAADRPIVVTGMVIAPDAAAMTTDRPVVAWAHPTTGIEDRCAPSVQAKPFDSIMGLSEFLAAGWVVVATDYEGLGTDGPHPYLDGPSEARAVLDSVRAAHSLGEAHASSRFGVFGHSQGGQAALFAGQLATSYAPDLALVGVVAAAPSGDLRQQFDLTADTEAYSYVGSYMVASWAQVHDTDPTTAVAPAATEQTRRLANDCVVGGSVEADTRLTQIFDDDPAVDPSLWIRGFTGTAPWATLLADNSPGSSEISVPTLVTQGTADRVILPATTSALVARLRANGTDVTEQLLDGVPHTQAGDRSVPYALSMFTRAFEG